jgi:[glutamine synthetase] adenylyltransferase / [glutamine synthetase]-adenylyl-L-tyrosine phosphorylase
MVMADRITESELARLGLGGADAVPSLRAMGVWGEHGALPECNHVVRALAASPNSAHALGGLERLAQAHPKAWRRLVAGEALLTRVATVAGASDALTDLIVMSPDALDTLTGALQPWEAADVERRAADVLADPDASGHQGPVEALVAFQRRGLLRIAARDLIGHADTPMVAAELADLAQGILAAALTHVTEPGEDPKLAVIGMGKLGGCELNFVSDVDVMFVAEGDWSVATRTAERFLRLLGQHTPHGIVYEIDTNLRPEGRDGNLVRSLSSFRSYYERWAKTWEFQALLKARPVAGDEAVGGELIELAAPFVWPDRLEGGRVGEIQAMKVVVEQSKPVIKDGARQLKLAPGGLRDIEFAVQLLQLVHGRHDPSLRSPNTLLALRALAEGGYVDEGDAALFSDAYQFLRTIEHRIQLRRLRRSHTVPGGEEERARLARSAGFRDIRAASALVQFDREYQRVQGYTRRLHEKLFYRPLLERFAEFGAEDQVGLADRLGTESSRERLAALGFDDPDRALAHLEALASGVSRRARLFRTLLPAVLPTLAASPDPDGGLADFRSLAEKLGESPAFVRTLRDNPPVGQLLARVLGASRVLGRWLERQPEVVSSLADLGQLAEPVAPEDYQRLAQGLLRRGDGPEGAGGPLRRMKRREVARIAVRDLAGHADVVAVGRELTGVAEACLSAGIALVAPEGVRMAVIALGKLGGRELGYASDLDIVFVHDGAGDAAVGGVESLLQLLSGITPEGQAFHVDLNLRPEGKNGVLTRTLDSYRSYYQRWAEPWELQALTLARPVAGDAELGADFLELIRPFVYPAQVPAERLQAVRQMKARVERERGSAGRAPARTAPRRLRPGAVGPRTAGVTPRGDARGRPGDRIDLKVGPGGLSDVEWTVQLQQLRHGGRLPALQQPGTLAGLAALEAVELLPAQDAQWLADGWKLLTRVRNGLYLLGARDSSILHPGTITHERLARLLGYPAPGSQGLAEDLGRAMRRVRKVHERRFYDV